MSKRWKQVERDYAAWFGTFRNPLSGRNNRDDAGKARLGDIIHPTAVVEIKHRRTISFSVAKETRDLANEHGKHWLCMESCPGEANLIKLVMSKDMASDVCAYIARTHFKGKR